MSIQDILFMLEILTEYSQKRKDFLTQMGTVLDSSASGGSQTHIFIAYNSITYSKKKT